MSDVHVEASGEYAMAEEDLCRAVGEDLSRHYAGHPWCVGADLTGGYVVIDLGYEKPQHLRNMAYMLHPRTLMTAGGQQRVMQAGGEILERFGLPRGPARSGCGERALENGLIADDTAEGAWAARKAGVLS